MDVIKYILFSAIVKYREQIQVTRKSNKNLTTAWQSLLNFDRRCSLLAEVYEYCFAALTLWVEKVCQLRVWYYINKQLIQIVVYVQGHDDLSIIGWCVIGNVIQPFGYLPIQGQLRKKTDSHPTFWKTRKGFFIGYKYATPKVLQGHEKALKVFRRQKP
jgi:hypothetical protein